MLKIFSIVELYVCLTGFEIKTYSIRNMLEDQFLQEISPAKKYIFYLSPKLFPVPFPLSFAAYPKVTVDASFSSLSCQNVTLAFMM